MAQEKDCSLLADAVFIYTVPILPAILIYFLTKNQLVGLLAYSLIVVLITLILTKSRTVRS